MIGQATLRGKLPTELANDVSDRIFAATVKGMSPGEAACVTVAVAADYYRNEHGTMDGLADVVGERGWLPIAEITDEARDGRPIQVYVEDTDEQKIVRWMTSPEDNSSEWVIARANGSQPVAFVCRGVTHWRYCPLPPNRGTRT